MRRSLGAFVDRTIAWRQGRRFPQDLVEFRALEEGSADAIRAFQERRALDLLRHAATHVPFWRERLRALGAQIEDFRSLDDLARLPLVSKDDINRAGASAQSEERRQGRITQSSTGGSTGKNVWFLIDGFTHDRRRAAGRLTEEWDGVVPGTRLATLWGAALDQKPSRGSRLYDALTQRVFISAYGVDREALIARFDELARFRPEVISSYPSILTHAAQLAGRERCRRLGARIIYCSAEALDPTQRAALEDHFGARVRNRYASREFGMIAAECPAEDGLHLMDMRLYVEFLDDPAAPGYPELVITDLDNRTMPLIRYRIEDLAPRPERACACGRPWTRIAAVEGRRLDVVVTPEGRAFGGTFFTLTMRALGPLVDQFQVVQDRYDHLLVRVVPGTGWDAAARTALLAALERGLGPGMAIDLREEREIPALASGKRRFVVRDWTP